MLGAFRTLLYQNLRAIFTQASVRTVRKRTGKRFKEVSMFKDPSSAGPRDEPPLTPLCSRSWVPAGLGRGRVTAGGSQLNMGSRTV